MAQIRQEINILDRTTPGGGGADSATGELISLTTGSYDGTVTYYFEAIAKVASGTYTVTLQRAGTTTDDATLTFTETSYTRKRVSFTPGVSEYEITASGGVSGSLRAARIVITQNTAPITKTETQIEIGNSEFNKTNTTKQALTNPKYWYFDSTKWDATTAFYAEVTYRISSSMENVTIVLQEDDGSFANWTDKVTIVSAGTSTSPDLVRSASFTPTSGRNYRLAASITSNMENYQIYNAKIIVISTNSPTKIEAQYLLLNTPDTLSTGLLDYDTYFDPAEWVSVTNTYIHEGNGVSAGTADLKLQEDPNGTPADITGSTITDCIEREQSSALTMPASAKEIDVNVTSILSAVNASRILAQVSIDPVGGLIPTQGTLFINSKFF